MAAPGEDWHPLSAPPLHGALVIGAPRPGAHPWAGMCPLVACSLLGTPASLSRAPALALGPVGLRCD